MTIIIIMKIITIIIIIILWNFLTWVVYIIRKISNVKIASSLRIVYNCTSVSMGTNVTLGDAKQAKTSCKEVKGVSVGLITLWPRHWPHM